jgi:hypothetical protein
MSETLEGIAAEVADEVEKAVILLGLAVGLSDESDRRIRDASRALKEQASRLRDAVRAPRAP